MFSQIFGHLQMIFEKKLSERMDDNFLSGIYCKSIGVIQVMEFLSDSGKIQ